MRELVKVWRNSGFSLRVYDLNRHDEMGKWVLGYVFRDGGKIVFEGEDFHNSPCHAIDSLNTVYSLLSFLSLREGDTDREYFDHYTPAQLEWRDSGRAEELNLIVIGGEERLAKRRR